MKPSTPTVLSVAASLLTLSGCADAFWRLPCRARSGLARLDPLMNNGDISDHVHAIHGGGNFNMDSDASDLISSNCTSCQVTEDKSAYWTPSLHFMYPNGTTVIVQQVGGMLAYYLLYSDPSDSTGTITAFPEGFQMISGDKRQRNFTWPVPDPPKSDWSGDEVSQFALSQKALGFNCLNYAAAPEGSLYRHFLPDKAYLDANCLDGIRLELMFPSCWNGIDVDSSDHKSHVAFPDLVMTGTCPDGFKTKLPSLFYETIWNTYEFVGEDGQFVLSMGDPTGYGYHGDFMMGWDPSFLQQAVDTCTNPSGEVQDCALFTLQSDDDAATCQIEIPEVLANDSPTSRNGLAINVPIQSGPGYATTYAVVGASEASSVIPSTSSAASTAVVPTLTYSAATSAVSDNYGGVTLDASMVVSTASPASTVASTSAQQTSQASTSAQPTSQASVQLYVSTTDITAAPSITSGSSTPSIVATSWVTSGNEVVEMVIEQTVITVTATSSPTAVGKRHLYEHQHRQHGKRGHRS